MCAVPKLGCILGDGRAGVVPGLQVLNPAKSHRLDRLAPCRNSLPLMALLGLSVTSDLSPQRVEQRTSPAAFDVAGLLVASSAMALDDAIICAGLAGGIG